MKLTFTPTPERASSESRTANGNARLVWGLINPKKGSSPAKQDHEIALVALSEEKDTEVLRLPSGAKVINIGAGKKKEMTRRKFILLLRKVVATAKANKIARMEIPFGAFLKFSKNPANATDVAELMACQFTLADFEFDKYKTEGAEERAKAKLAEVIISGNLSPKVKKAFERGTKIGEEINACRMLANTPAGEMTPRMLASDAEQAAKNLPIRVTVLGVKEIKKLGMGGILGVSQGSSEEPRFIVMEYMKGRKSERPVVLVGKGVTFDSGGLNVKPGDYMNEMHMDMSGGAAVIRTVVLAARLNLKKNIVGLVPAVENMPSGSSYRPGDILKTMSGKTIEIGNTDAEGRVILADALTYAERYQPRLVVDVATLTGAAVAALGQRASALFTKNEKLSRLFERLGEESGEYVWPLPLWDEYEEDIKGTFGDWNNSGKTRWGGAITGAMFLYQFAKKYPWVHIDIAPRMTSIDGDYLAKGAAGAPMGLLVRLLEKF